MKNVLLAAAILNAGAIASINASTLSIPDQCPNVSEIAAAGLDYFDGDTGAWLMAKANQSYGTSEKWDFAIGYIYADNQFKAYKKAMKIIPHLHLFNGPVKQNDVWLCEYINPKNDVYAIALTPSLFSNHSVRSYFSTHYQSIK